MSEFGRVIDLDRCIGCRACVAACNVENHGDEQSSWQVVISQENGRYPFVSESYTPMGCMHCRDAPCEKVCAQININAISTNEFGVVIFDQQKCIGCGYCHAVCPYGAPRIKQQRSPSYGEDGATPYDHIANKALHPLQQHKTGKAQKCTFCAHKIEAAAKADKLDRVGIDPQYTPSCDLVCPVDARVFGDLSDPQSAVSKRIGQTNAQPMKKSFGTRPRVYYSGGS